MRKPEITCLVHLIFLLDIAGVRVYLCKLLWQIGEKLEKKTQAY